MPDGDWPFDEPRNEAVITVRQIAFESAPILHVCRDFDGWQFLTLADAHTADAAVLALEEVVAKDSTLRQLADLPRGWHAWRESTQHPWSRAFNPRTTREALAYVKGDVRDADPAPVVHLNEDDSPVLKRVAEGLHVAYLVDEGDEFSYVQGKHLKAAELDVDQLHALAVANLKSAAEGRVTVREIGPAWMLVFDGHFEASLILLDDLWEGALRAYHAGDPAIALPARDVLCFCDLLSSAGVAELRGVIQRIWPAGDHLVSDKLFRRRDGVWVPFEIP
jgi:Protein of unknown function (DUF1444)